MNGTADTLLVLPYVGEFGWELMNWQGRVRWIIARSRRRRVVICAQNDRRLLYAQSEDKARVVFCAMTAMDVPGRCNDDHRVDIDGRPINPTHLRQIVASHAIETCRHRGIDTAGAELFAPDYRSTVWPTTPDHQLFNELRVPQTITTDVVLVPRWRIHGQERNQPRSWWQDLAERLRSHGLTVEHYTPRLEEAVRQLSRARLAAGASTGGLHLASLCRCPHYVWGSGPEVRWTCLGITNRQRYETIWNPFGTPCLYDPCGWQPSVEHVVSQVRRALDSIGLNPNRIRSHRSWNPKWRIKRRLARLLETNPRYGLYPWRLRQVVRKHLI